MGQVRQRQVDYRLGKLIRSPGGRTVAAIQGEVEARLARMAGECLIDAQGRVWRMAQLAAALPPEPTRDDFLPFYEPCNDIVGLAGVGRLAHAGHAALSLTRLLHGWTSDSPWSRTALKVHLDALALLCRLDSDPDPEARDRIVEGLERVVQRHRRRQNASPRPSRRRP